MLRWLKFKKSPTNLVVFGGLALSCILGAFYLVGVYWGILVSLILAYEFYTFINPFPQDTLSEVIVQVSEEHPYLPVLICLALGYAIGKGVFGDPEDVLRGVVLGALVGHWWWRLK